MTKIVLCYGVILGLYCLLHGVCCSEDGPTAKHYNAKHDNRQRGDGYTESGIPKDKVFIKSESPLRGRKIHQTAWSEEEVTQNSQEEFKTAESTGSRDSWNFEKLYNYLLSLIYKTEEMEQAKMTSSEKVEMMRNRIKSEIKARKQPDSEGSESKRLIHETDDFEMSYLDRGIENSYSSEESEEYESCEEDEDSSTEMYDSRKNKGTIKHKDAKENGSENNGSEVEDCYEDEESGEKSSVKKDAGSTNAKTDVKKDETTSPEERKQSTSITKNEQLSGQDITVLNGTSVKDNQNPINILRKPTSAGRIGTNPKFTGTTPESKNTAKMNKGGNVGSNTDVGITLTTSSNVRESTIVNLPTESGLEKSTDLVIGSKPDIQEKVDLNVATESTAQVTPTESASTLNVNSVLLQKEISNPSTTTTQKGFVTDSKSATKTLPQDNFEVIKTAPEFIPISNKEIGNSEMSSNKIPEVKPNIDELLSIPVEVAHIYGGPQSEVQKVDKSETQSETSLDTAGKISMGDSLVFTQENIENNNFQQESFFNYGRKDDILEEYNLKNEFIELSDSNKNEFMNMLNDYNMNNLKSDDGHQHSSVSQNDILVENNMKNEFIELSDSNKNEFMSMLNDYNMNNLKSDDGHQHSSVSQNVEYNEENTNQETFDTILEFLYKHSKNPLILSLRNSNKTLF